MTTNEILYNPAFEVRYVGTDGLVYLDYHGDKIVAINDHFVNNYDKLALEMTIAGNEEFKMTLKNKEGKKYNVTVNGTAYEITLEVADAAEIKATAPAAAPAAVPVVREVVKYLDKPQRRITEIRLFYDDGTYETFS